MKHCLSIRSFSTILTPHLFHATHTLDAKTWEEANVHRENLYSTQAPLEVRAISGKAAIC